MSIEQMSAGEIVEALRGMVRVENRLERDVLIALFELERRGEIARAGYGRVAEFCVEELGMREKAARCRAKAIGMMARFPAAAEAMREGALTMTTLLAVDADWQRDLDTLRDLAAHSVGTDTAEVLRYAMKI